MAARIMSETVSTRYEFTDKERGDLGKELADIYQHKLTLEEEEKAVKDQFKERKSQLELKSGALSRQITAGFEMRQVDCTLSYDSPNVGEVTYYRKDTGAVLKTRAMTLTERQMDLPLTTEAPPATDEAVEASVERSEEAVKDFFGSEEEFHALQQKNEDAPKDEEKPPPAKKDKKKSAVN